MGLFNRIFPVRGPNAPAEEPVSTRNLERAPDLSVLIDNLPEVVFCVTKNGTWTFLGAAWNTLSGYRIEDSLGRSCIEYVHPEDRPAWNNYVEARFAGGKCPVSLSIRMVRKNGEPVWVEAVSAVLDRQPQGEGPPQLIGTLADIDEYVSQENLRRAGHRALETIVSDLPAMVYRCRANKLWTMEFCSAGCSDLTGYSPEDLTSNRTLAFVELIHVDDQQRVWNLVQAALREDRPFNVVYRLVTADGTVKWVLDAGRGNYTASGDLLTIDGFIVELTSWRHYEEKRDEGLLYDMETGLPNRALFADRLKQKLLQARRGTGRSFALLYLQMDRYDTLKKSYEAGVAERVVTELGTLLRGHIEPPDTLARIEPAGFGLLIDSTGGDEGPSFVTRTCRRLEELVLTPLRVDNHQIFITASIGVALSSSGYTSGESMIMDAATALSRASNLGGRRYEIFDLQSHAEAAAWSQMAEELESAAGKGEFDVLWQPIVGNQQGRIAGLEGRLVWNHPRHGQLFAEEFVPVANESQYVVPLWEWMITRVAAQMQKWHEAVAPGQISVNVYIHGQSLMDTNSMLRLADRLAAVATPSCRLSIGIPESILDQPESLIEELIAGVGNRGLDLVIDGFGSGPLSLSVKKWMPVSAVRLTTKLVEESSVNSDLVRAIAAFAHSLGIDVIASPIASAEQRRVLEATGVDFLQGPVISAPLSDAEVLAYFIRQSRDPN